MKPKFIVVDLETTGSDWKKDGIHGIGVYDGTISSYTSNGSIWRISHGHIPQLSLLADPEVAIVGHNTRFDIRFLKAAGIEVNGTIHDTMLMAKMLDEHQKLGLKDLMRKNRIGDLGALDDLLEVLKDLKLKHVGELCKLDLKTGGFTDLIGKYCEEDCRNTYELFLLLSKKLQELDKKLKDRFNVLKTPLDVYKEELAPMESILIDMEMRGVVVDKDYQATLGKELLLNIAQLEPKLNKTCKAEIATIEERMVEKKRETLKTDEARARYFPGSHKHTTFSWSAPAQVADLVYKGLKIHPGAWQKTEKGRLSVGSKVRPRVMLDITPKHPAFSVLEDYQKLAEAKRSYKLFVQGDTDASLTNCEHKGKIHGEFIQYPDTGRLAHRSPNMGNLPRGGQIKKLFTPNLNKVFWYFDYSQVEFRILAHLSKDPKMIEACNGDPHQMTADLCGVDRATAKTINFAFLYGAYPKKAQNIFLTQADTWKSVEECEELRERFFEGYKQLMPWLVARKKAIRTYGFAITPTGYMRRFPEVFDTDDKWEVMGYERKGVNLLGQGFGASIMKRAMISLYKEGYSMVSQVHDSAIGELDKSSDLCYHTNKIQQIAENAFKLRVPLVAEVKLLNSFDEGDTYICHNTQQKKA